MPTVKGHFNISSASPDILHKLQISSQGASHPCKAFSPKKSPLWRVRMYFSASLFGCFIVTFTWNTDQSLTTSSVNLSHDEGDCFATHLSFTDDEESVTTSTLSDDVITRPVECLKQESVNVSIMPEGNINSQQGSIQINHQLDTTVSPVYYPDVYLQLNMFRASSRPSSGAQWLQ